jgi:hypothetical protein
MSNRNIRPTLLLYALLLIFIIVDCAGIIHFYVLAGLLPISV